MKTTWLSRLFRYNGLNRALLSQEHIHIRHTCVSLPSEKQTTVHDWLPSFLSRFGFTFNRNKSNQFTYSLPLQLKQPDDVGCDKIMANNDPMAFVVAIAKKRQFLIRPVSLINVIQMKFPFQINRKISHELVVFNNRYLSPIIAIDKRHPKRI